MRATFRFHAVTLRLLDGRPIFSPSGIARIERCEELCGQRLPESVREWYCLESPDQWLADSEFGCLASSLDRLLSDHQRLCTSRDRRISLWSYHSESTGYSATVFPDGSDDPPVEEQVQCEGPQAPFSRFVCELVWGRLTSHQRLHAFTHNFSGWLGPPHLDYLAENFEELSRQRRVGRRNPFATGPETELWSFRYFGGGVRIRVIADGDPTTGERPAEWTVHADGEKQLFATLRGHWPFPRDHWEFSRNDSVDAEMGRRFADPEFTGSSPREGSP